MRQLQEIIDEAELMHDLKRRRVDGVAAEIAEEVSVLFKNDDTDSGARQQ